MQQQQDSTVPSDWKHLPAVAVQAIGQHCCPASKARLRLTCAAWHQALATQFSTLYMGPGHPAGQHASADQHRGLQHRQQQLPAWALGERLHKAFPAVSRLQLTASSSRDYEETFVQDLAHLLASQRRLTELTIQEVHELEELDTLDPASLWDVLAAATPVLAGRLQALHVAGCFWNQPELFEGLRQLTAVTQLRLANTPLETAYELRVVASMTQLVQLELGIIFDGSSAHHDVPRALESLGDLQQLQALCIPMWRRSLGGRAHPLAPALSAALRRLTGLTNLAVDGKFSQLGVVSGLTNLRQLASAAPLSKEGWQAICQLPQLTLLTSLTPSLEPLLLNPERPHLGCDLAQLKPKASLAGMDVAVLSPEHLASLAQFTALRQLNLRCSATFQLPQQQAQLLTAVACLPPTLTMLSFGPLLPLSAQLFRNIASSCTGLLSLQASFTHTVVEAIAVSSSNTSSAAAAAAAAGGMHEQLGHQQQLEQGMDLDGEQQELASTPFSSVSQALGALKWLQELDLVLLSDVERSESPTLAAAAAARRSSSYGGFASSPPPPPAAATGAYVPAAAGDTALGAVGVGWPLPAAASSSHGFGSLGSSSDSRSAGLPVLLQFELLPRSLKTLKLSGNWLLCCETASASSAQQQQMQKAGGAVCQVCQRRAAAVGDAASASRLSVVAADGGGVACSLCDCMQGLQLAGTGPQQQQQQQVSGWRSKSGARVSNSSSTSGSPTRNPLAGLKRPASYPTVLQAPAAPEAATAAAAAGVAGGGVLAAVGTEAVTAASREASVSGVVQQQGGVFVFEQQQAVQKRSRSFGSMQAAAAGAHRLSDAASRGQQQQLPQLVELCLYRVHIPYQALSAIVKAAGPCISQLQLLQLSVLKNTNIAYAELCHEALQQQQQQQRQRREQQEQQDKQQQQQQQQPGGSYLTTEQLLQLPVAWSCLQELYIHPYQLWGMLSAGCMVQQSPAASLAGPAAASAAASASPAAAAEGLEAAAALQPLRHVTQLRSLRHLYVTDTPSTFEATAPASSVAPPSRLCRVPCVLLPEQAVELTALLTALQTGLQQLPALRQLLFHMGLPMCATSARPGLVGEVPDFEHVWMEAGEVLLQALPAVRVRQFRPSSPSLAAPGVLSMLQAVTLPEPVHGLRLLQSADEDHGVGDRAAAAAGSTPAVGQATGAAEVDGMEPEYMV